MRKILLLTLAIVPLFISCSKKDKTEDPPEENGPKIEASTWLEVAPVNGRSRIIFNKDYTFTVRNLNQEPTGSAILDHVYRYKIENGKIVAQMPWYDSYWYQNPITYTFITNRELYIDNFRPTMWIEKVTTIRLKRVL